MKFGYFGYLLSGIPDGLPGRGEERGEAVKAVSELVIDKVAKDSERQGGAKDSDVRNVSLG